MVVAAAADVGSGILAPSHRQQARAEAGVQPPCVALIDDTLWRPNRVNEAFDYLVDSCVQSVSGESRAA